MRHSTNCIFIFALALGLTRLRTIKPSWPSRSCRIFGGDIRLPRSLHILCSILSFILSLLVQSRLVIDYTISFTCPLADPFPRIPMALTIWLLLTSEFVRCQTKHVQLRYLLVGIVQQRPLAFGRYFMTKSVQLKLDTRNTLLSSRASCYPSTASVQGPVAYEFLETIGSSSSSSCQQGYARQVLKDGQLRASEIAVRHMDNKSTDMTH